MSQKIGQFWLQAYFNLRRTLSSRINSIKRSSIFKVRQTPTRVPLIKTPGENSQSIFSSMDSDMQTVSTNILSSQGFFAIQASRHRLIGMYEPAWSLMKPFKEEIHQTVRKLYVSILVPEVTTQKILQQLQITMFKKWLKTGSQRLKKCKFTLNEFYDSFNTTHIR